MTPTRQFCTFFLGGNFFGLDLRYVLEINRIQSITKVPLASDTIRGLLNIRGEIITCLDTRVALGMQTFPQDAEPMNIVVRAGQEQVCLTVDAVDDIIDVHLDALDAVPSRVPWEIRRVASQVYALPGQIMLVFDGVEAIIPSRQRRQQSL